MDKFIIFLKNIFSRFNRKANQSAVTKTCTILKPVNKPPADNPANVTNVVEDYLQQHYEFRFNRLTETTEYRQRQANAPFITVGQRELNMLCIEARKHCINCWDRDISRYVNSAYIPSYHPFESYINGLPTWDGADRITPLAKRVSDDPVWIKGFRCWMLGVTAQWTGIPSLHANSVAPVLVSRQQGKHKSTFCRMLVPQTLQAYYTDSFDLGSVSSSEQKLTAFGLINLDELDKYSPRKMAQLKNLMQMAGLTIRKAYKKNYSSLPRIASFIATSNQKELLTDPTGSRRFLCVEVKHKIDCSTIEHKQLFAQLKHLLAHGERYWFTGKEEAEVMHRNTAFQKRGLEEDVFFACFRFPEPDETPLLLSGAYIFNHLKKHNPPAMRNVCPSQFGKVLTALGIERIHTEKGNLYRVIRVA